MTWVVEVRHEREHFRVGGGNVTKALGRIAISPSPRMPALRRPP
jgi:hypothetical protein